MFTFLEDLPRVSRGFFLFQKYDSYRRQFSASVEQQRLYWQRNHFTVPSDHLLVRILRTLPISYTLDVKTYYSLACDIAYDVTRPFGVTSIDAVGTSTSKSWLFGKDFVEFPICLFEREPKNLEALAARWKDLVSVKFLRHPRTDLSLGLPNGTAPSGEPGLVVYQIDLPILALQYRQFILEQLNKPKGTRETTMQFVSRYVLANAIPSMVDVAFFNRLNALLSQEQTAISEWRYASAIPNNLRWLDEYLGDIVRQLKGNSYSFAELLYGIRTITGDCLYDLCKYPESIRTRQASWLTYLAQMPFVNFLVKAAAESNRRPNLAEINSILRDFKYAGNDQIWQSKVPSNVLLTVSKEIISTVENCGKLL